MAYEPWMTADRAEQESTGTRYIPRPKMVIDPEAVRAQVEANRGTPWKSTETETLNRMDGSTLEVPTRLGAPTVAEWYAAQGGDSGSGSSSVLDGFLGQYASQNGGSAAVNTADGMIPNIDSSAPEYSRRLKPYQAQRLEAQGVIADTFGETFRMMPVGSDPNDIHIVAAEYYTYRPISAENAQGQLYQLPMYMQDYFKSTAEQMGRYPGELSPEGLYVRMLDESRKRAGQGKFDAPEEIYMELVENGVLPMPLSPDQQAAADAGGGGGGGGGYGGGGGGGATVNLTTPQQARFYVEQAYKSLLGRAPSEDEINNFIAVLREAELNNPVTVEDVGGVMAQTGGYDPQILASEMAKAEDDYKTRGANNYYNMFMDMLGGG